MEINVINIEMISPVAKERQQFEKTLRKIIKIISVSEARKFSLVNILFCDDKFIRDYNRRFLDHDYATDIITFFYSENDAPIEGELLVSWETVLKNSRRFRTDAAEEIYRVLIHGLLHLCGYDDKSASGKKEMRLKENQYLKYIKNAGKNN